MNTKRGQRMAPPAGADQWEVRCARSDAGKGWDELCQQAPNNARWAWEQMSQSPAPTPPNGRHHPLKGTLSEGMNEGRRLPLWQIEVTSSARVWYLLDSARRTVRVVHAGSGHPKRTG